MPCKWSEVDGDVLGKIGEQYAIIEFMSYGFDVRISMVDNCGVDFYAYKNNKEFKVQVKSVRPYSYTFIKKSDDSLFDVTDSEFLVCYLRFLDDHKDYICGVHPQIYIFRATIWMELKTRSILKDVLSDYSCRKNNPEYGIKFNKTKGNDVLMEYSADKFFQSL